MTFDRIARFEISGLIRRGGMASVYLGHDPGLARPVAVKVLADELAAEPRFRERFLREAQAAALDHPNIVPVYERGESDGHLYVAMRYVAGGDLGDLVHREGALPVDRALAIVRQAGRALDHAHRHGTVHRDVKPGNILVDPGDDGDHAYLTDFGIAKLLTDTVAASTLTATGHAIGTVAYMAPEQFTQDPVDARTDVYALACVLYECLTGQAPFSADTPAQVMFAHLQGDRPRVSVARAEVPAALDDVLAGALAVDPADRPVSCAALADAVQAAIDRPHAPTVVDAPPPGRDAPVAPAATEVMAPGPLPGGRAAAPPPARPDRGRAVPAAVFAAVALAFVAGIVLWRLNQPTATDAAGSTPTEAGAGSTSDDTTAPEDTDSSTTETTEDPGADTPESLRQRVQDRNGIELSDGEGECVGEGLVDDPELVDAVQADGPPDLDDARRYVELYRRCLGGTDDVARVAVQTLVHRGIVDRDQGSCLEPLMARLGTEELAAFLTKDEAHRADREGCGLSD